MQTPDRTPSAASARVVKSVMGVPANELDRYGNRVLPESPRPIDNFARHTWFMFGLAMGIGMTALIGWVFALTFMAGWGTTMWVLYAFASGRLSWHRRGRDVC